MSLELLVVVAGIVFVSYVFLQESRRRQNRRMVAVVTSDASGRVTSWNEGAAALLGHASHRIVGRPLTDLMPVRYRADHLRAFDSVRQGGPSHLSGQTLDLSALHRDGSEVPVQLTLNVWRDDDGDLYVTGIMERVEAE